MDRRKDNMLKTDRSSLELQKLFAIDNEKTTDRYSVIYYKGNYEIFDNSLYEVIFTGKASDIKIFIKGFNIGRTTVG